MKLNPFVFGVLVLAVFMGTVLSAQATGNWSISGKVTATGEKVTATGANPDEIKGWMTLGEVSAAYGTPLEEIVKQFELPAGTDGKKQLKELESEMFSTTKLKEWLKLRTAQ